MNAKTYAAFPSGRCRRRPILPAVIFAALLAGSHLHAQNTTAVTILKPLNGATLNAASLDVQALVADFVAAPPGANLLTYWTQVNAGPGRLTHAELRLDGVLVQTRTLQTCLRQDLVTFPVSLANLTQGTHQLQVTAYQKQGTVEVSKAVSVSFTLDATVNAPQSNPIEHAATPQPFACLLLAGFDADAGPVVQPGIQGRLRLGDNSDGINLATERVALDIGTSKTVLEPGSFVCNGGTCTFPDNSQPVVRSAQFASQPDGSWTFLLQANLPANPASFYLRIGNDWGGRLLTTGEYVSRLRTTLDGLHRAQATIGTAGGSIQAVNASGVKIRLDIPAGALTRNTAITLSALTGTPLVNPPSPLDVGVQFDPEGLQFSNAATLTFDFSATGKILTGKESLYLMTAPGTKVPLYGTVNLVNRTITAHIWHFSDMEPDSATASFEDLKAWADSFLASVNGNVTFQSLEAAAALAADQMKLGCTQNCIDLSNLANSVQTAITNLVTAACPADISNPTDQAFARYLELESLAQGMGAGIIPGLSTCYKQILSGLIDKAGIDALASATQAPDDPKLTRLNGYAATAYALGFGDLQTRAWTRMAQALRSLEAFLSARAHASDGTPNEAAAHQQGIDGLTQDLQWVTTIAPGVSAVDPALAGLIQAAIDGLKDLSQVLILGGTQVLAASAACNGRDYSLPFNDPERNRLFATQPAPASLSVSADNCELNWTASSPDAKTIAVDVSAVGVGISFQKPDIPVMDGPCKFGCAFGNWGAFIPVQFTVAKPGTLVASLAAVNPPANATYGFVVASDPGFAGPFVCAGKAIDVVVVPAGTYALPQDFYGTAYNPCPANSGLNGSLALPSAGTYVIYVSVSGEFTFNGRAVTLTFTPN